MAAFPSSQTSIGHKSILNASFKYFIYFFTYLIFEFIRAIDILILTDWFILITNNSHAPNAFSIRAVCWTEFFEIFHEICSLTKNIRQTEFGTVNLCKLAGKENSFVFCLLWQLIGRPYSTFVDRS